MVTSCDGMTSPEGPAISILSKLSNKATPADDRVGLYGTLAQEFQKDNITGVLHVMGQQGSPLSALFCSDIQSDKKELNQASLRILGLCLHYEEIAKSFSEADSISIVTALCNTILKTEDKSTSTRALWCLSRQQLPSKTVQSGLHNILCALEHVLQQNKFQSMTAEHEAVNLLIRLLEQIPDVMNVHTARWAPLLFPLIVHSAHKIRVKADQATQLALPALRKHQVDLAPSLAAALKSTMIVDMAELFANKQEQFVLRVWKMFVELLGKALHKGGSLINLLLRVVEQGFKHGYPEVKRDAFDAWRVLIDNFSLDLDVLSNAKRLKLLMQPFLATSTKQESVALAKFGAWWHLCTALGPRLCSNFEVVVIPLLHFCLGTSTPSINPGSHASATTPSSRDRMLMNSVGFRALAMSSPATTPMMDLSSPFRGPDPYRSLLLRGIVVMAYMLSSHDGHVNCEAVRHQINDPPDPIPVIPRGAQVIIKVASSLIPIVVNSIQQHFALMGENLCVEMFDALTQYVKNALENSKKQDNAEMFGVFLYNLNMLVKHADVEPLTLLKFTASLKCLPTKVLSSTAYVSSHVGCVLNGTPTLFLLELLFSPKMIKASTDERYFLLLERLVECGISVNSSVLGFSTVYISLVDGASSTLSNKETVWRIWSILASPLFAHILQSNEVNQGDSFEHDFSAMIGCLLFPIQKILPFDIPTPTRKSLLKTWTNLYHAFARCAAMVTTAGDNQSCQDLCAKIVSFVLDENFRMTLSFMEAISQVCRVMLDSVDFSSYSDQAASDVLQSPVGKWNKKHHWPLKNLSAFVKLLCHLMNSFHKHRSQYEKPSEAFIDSWFSVVSNCCHIITVLFAHIGRTSLLQQLIARLAKPLSGFYGKGNRFPPGPVYKTCFLPKFDKLWQSVLTGVQARYPGPYDAESLVVFEPLLEATLTSPHRSIRNHTLLFWNATFAKATSLKYSDRMKLCLQGVKKTNSLTLPDWSDVEDETDMPADESAMQSLLVPSTLSPSPRKIHGSFLTRQSEARKLFVSSSPFKSPAKSPLQAKRDPSPAKERMPTRRKLNIEDESTQDFVFVAPSPKKRQALTEHQKEMMREKRDLPALYNDLEQSQDTQVFSELTSTQSQFPDKSLDTPSPDNADIEKNILTNAFAALKEAEDKSAESEPDVVADVISEPVKLLKDKKVVTFVNDDDKQGSPAEKGTDDFVAKMNEKIKALRSSTGSSVCGSAKKNTTGRNEISGGENSGAVADCSVTVIAETQSQNMATKKSKVPEPVQGNVKEQTSAKQESPAKGEVISDTPKVIPETQGDLVSRTVVSPSVITMKDPLDKSPKTPESQSFPFEVEDGLDLTDITFNDKEVTPRIKISTPRVKVQKLDLAKLESSQTKVNKEQRRKTGQTTPIITPSPTGSQTPNETPRFKRHKSEEVFSRSAGSGRRVRKWHSFGDAKTDSPKEKLSPNEVFSPPEIEESDSPSLRQSPSGHSGDKMEDIEGIQPLDCSFDADVEMMKASDSQSEEKASSTTAGEAEIGEPSLRRGRRNRKAKAFSDFITHQKVLSSVHPADEGEMGESGLELLEGDGDGIATNKREEGSTEVVEDEVEKVWNPQVKGKNTEVTVEGDQVHVVASKMDSGTTVTLNRVEGTNNPSAADTGKTSGTPKSIRRVKPVPVPEEGYKVWEPSQELFSQEMMETQEWTPTETGKAGKMAAGIDGEKGNDWTDVRENRGTPGGEGEIEAEMEGGKDEDGKMDADESVTPLSSSKKGRKLGRGRRKKKSKEVMEVIDLCDTQSQETDKEEGKNGSGAVCDEVDIGAVEGMDKGIKCDELDGETSVRGTVKEGRTDRGNVQEVFESKTRRSAKKDKENVRAKDAQAKEGKSKKKRSKDRDRVTIEPRRVAKKEESDHSDDEIPLGQLLKPKFAPQVKNVSASEATNQACRGSVQNTAKQVMDPNLSSDSPLKDDVEKVSGSHRSSGSVDRVESPKTRSISPKIRRNLSEKFKGSRRKSTPPTPLSARKKSPLRSPKMLRSASAIHTRLRSKATPNSQTKISPKMKKFLEKREKLRKEEKAKKTSTTSSSGEAKLMKERNEGRVAMGTVLGEEDGIVVTVTKLDENENIDKQEAVCTGTKNIDVLTQNGNILDVPQSMDLFGNCTGTKNIDLLTQNGNILDVPQSMDLFGNDSIEEEAEVKRSQEASGGNGDIPSLDDDDGTEPGKIVDNTGLTNGEEEIINSSCSPARLNPDNVGGSQGSQGSARHCETLKFLKGDETREYPGGDEARGSPVIPVKFAPGVHSSPVGAFKVTPSQGSPEVTGIPGVYSPKASPSSGILKKREEAGCSSPSPTNKNRRVKFSEKVSTKEIETRTPNRSPGSSRGRAGPKMSPSPLVTTTSSRVVSVMSKYITTPNASAEKQTRTSSSRQHSGRRSRSPGQRHRPRFHQRLLTPPTQGSPSSQVESSLEDPQESIYPQLSECPTSVEDILPQLTSSMWSRGLGQLMRARGIFTVGQLSILTPSEVQSLPIRCPKVSHLRWVLGKHHDKLQARATAEDGGAAQVKKLAEASRISETDKSSPATTLKRKRDREEEAPDTSEAKKLRLVEELEKLSEGFNDEVLNGVSPEQLFKAHGHINAMMDTIMGVLKAKYQDLGKPS